MGKKTALMAALAVLVSAAVFLVGGKRRPARPGFVATRGATFVIDGKPFRFIGANVAVMYRDEDRARMPETLLAARNAGVRVVRVWASGEGDEHGIKPVGGDARDWPRNHSFRRGPDDWNEDAFIHLDHVIAEAAKLDLRVQLTLCNWWRDTGGVTQYLQWAGITGAADDFAPYGINADRAMQFYTNVETRRLYRAHAARILSRRNTVTGVLYRDDPAIFGYELINEAQAVLGRENERREWVAEMSGYLKSLDPDHLVTPGLWGYRNARERREWKAEHAMRTIDFCDVHHYPRDDRDVFVDSPADLGAFIDNRMAAALALDKPLVIGEFGMGPEGFNGSSEADWYSAYFKLAERAGVAGAMFWILTPDAGRGYGVATTDQRDEAVRAVIRHAAAEMAAHQDASPPRALEDDGHNLVPHQFSFTRPAGATGSLPVVGTGADHSILYRFQPEAATSGRFEKLGSGAGYVWGDGVGFFEYTIPPGEERGQPGRIIVRAHLQPVLPAHTPPWINATRVTLYINNVDCGSRLVAHETAGNIAAQKWEIDSMRVRAAAAFDRPLVIRFEVRVDADNPFGLNISNWPAGSIAGQSAPVEIEIH